MTEHEIQKAVVRHCRVMSRLNKDYLWIFAVPNGGLRNVRVAKKLKAEGLTAGVSDLIVPIAKGEYHGAFIEVKTEKGRLQPTQKAFLQEMANRGYYTACTFGLRATIDTIDKYLNT